MLLPVLLVKEEEEGGVTDLQLQHPPFSQPHRHLHPPWGPAQFRCGVLWQQTVSLGVWSEEVAEALVELRGVGSTRQSTSLGWGLHPVVCEKIERAGM